MYDAVIVGSGPAGTFSAYALRGKNVLVLDVGYRPPPVSSLEGNLYSLRQKREDLFEQLIGKQFEGLRNIWKRPISLKLKSPYMSYVVQDAEKLSPIRSQTFDGVTSFATGGLANAWGAGVFRFNDRDLIGFPIASADLEPFYDELTEHIGVSGVNDDLVPYFGEDPRLLPPIRITRLAADIVERFYSQKTYFQGCGMTIGLSRLAVLTRPHNGRDPYRYDNLEFYRPYNPAIYNPAFTLDELVAKSLITLKSGFFVTRYHENSDHVAVEARNIETGSMETFRARTLILAGGALCTTKIVLTSNDDYASRLPILDNPMVCIPLIRPDRIGAPLEVNDGSLGQLNLVYDDPETGELLQAGLYGATGPLRSDVLFQFPLSISANLIWAKYLSPAMVLAMLFYPGKRAQGNYIRLTRENELEIEYHWQTPRVPEYRIMKAFRKIGYFSATPAFQYPRMGSSMHYAGTLPMRRNPGRYETDPDGLLSGTRSVYITDGACFSELPAKNLTFTIMANAMRIATKLRSAVV